MPTPETRYLLDIEQLVREYIAKEILDEVRDRGGVMTIRVLGEVLGNKADFSERVTRIAMDIASGLLTPRTVTAKKPAEVKVIQAIVKGLIADIRDRRGLKNEWNAIDEDVQQEIVDCWESIIGAALRGVL